MKDEFIGTVSTLSSEGHGIIKNDDFVVFVPFTAPLDKVTYQIEKKKKNFGIGKLLQVITPSPLRAFPRCPHFGVCGGCQLQHLSYESQVNAKKQWVQDAITRIGKIKDVTVPDVVMTDEQWSYRRRINLILKPQNECFAAGYTAEDQHTFLKISECPIFQVLQSQTINVIEVVQKMVSKLKPASKDEARLTILKTGQDKFILHFDFLQVPADLSVLKEYASPELFPNITVSSPRKEHSFGQSLEFSMTIEGLKICYSPKAFIQTHPEQSLKIYQKTESIVKELKPKNVLDLYCGIGISSLLVARNGSNVTGIEYNKQAIQLAIKNAQLNHIQKTRFIASSVEDVLDQLLLETAFDLIIVNPPREGLSPLVLDALCKLKPKHFLYISCMPSTLSRDLKNLHDSGLNISQIQPYDMFPQTKHVETLCLLQNLTK